MFRRSVPVALFSVILGLAACSREAPDDHAASGGDSATAGAGTAGGAGSAGMSAGGSPTGGTSASGMSTSGTGAGGMSTGGTGASGSSAGGATAGGMSAGGAGASGSSGGAETGGTGGAAAGAAGAAGTSGAGGAASTRSEKPRVINTTDLGADPDDEQSMVRQLVSANEFQLEGLIVTTSCWKESQNSTAMLDAIVDAYGEVLSNLHVHAEGYPSLEYLRSISVLGQTGYAMADVGNDKDSEGSELIIASVDQDDPRPVWVNCWGGCNTLAQAIWKVQNTRSADELAGFLSKLRVFDILGQDDAGAWMTKTFPDLFFIRATGVYGWAPSDRWLEENVQSHGPLGLVYPDRIYDTEGDTPSFLHLYPNGLHDPEKVDQGGWGGRFDTTKQTGIRGMSPVTNESEYDPYSMYGNTPEGDAAISRFSAGIDNDFEARMDWSITRTYAEANHHPLAVVAGDASRKVLEISASAGAEVSLSAAGSSDPDDDALAYSWSFYAEPSSYDGPVTIQGAATSAATLTVPADAAGTTLHVLLELSDDGSPNLYAYRRVIIDVE